MKVSSAAHEANFTQNSQKIKFFLMKQIIFLNRLIDVYCCCISLHNNSKKVLP